MPTPLPNQQFLAQFTGLAGGRPVFATICPDLAVGTLHLAHFTGRPADGPVFAVAEALCTIEPGDLVSAIFTGLAADGVGVYLAYRCPCGIPPSGSESESGSDSSSSDCASDSGSDSASDSGSESASDSGSVSASDSGSESASESGCESTSESGSDSDSGSSESQSDSGSSESTSDSGSSESGSSESGSEESGSGFFCANCDMPDHLILSVESADTPTPETCPCDPDTNMPDTPLNRIIEQPDTWTGKMDTCDSTDLVHDDWWHIALLCERSEEFPEGRLKLTFSCARYLDGDLDYVTFPAGEAYPNLISCHPFEAEFEISLFGPLEFRGCCTGVVRGTITE